MDWTRELVQAVVDLAVSGAPPGEKKSAPIHVIFFDRYEQRLLLEALARNFPPILEATPPLYDFLTQLAAFDSPDRQLPRRGDADVQELPDDLPDRSSRVATYLKFDWNTPHKFRELFKARLFDYLGKLDIDGASEWYTQRSRFGSSMPLEYAYAAWGQLPTPKPGKGDEFADFRAVTHGPADGLPGAAAGGAGTRRQLDLTATRNTQKTPFVLPDLADYEDKADDLAHALHEFVTIERLVDAERLEGDPARPAGAAGADGRDACWSATARPTRSRAWPSRTGRTSGGGRSGRSMRRRSGPRTPTSQFRLTKEQAAECKWSPEGLRLRLRLETAGVDCDLHEALLLSNLRDGDRLVLFPRWTVDERLPVAERKEFTPTPKQMLYGQRAELMRHRGDREGRVGPGRRRRYAEVELKESVRRRLVARASSSRPSTAPLEDGKLYTLDPCPNDWYGYWCAPGGRGAVRRASRTSSTTGWSTRRRAGDGARLAGPGGVPGRAGRLPRRPGMLHDFETGKREFIGGHGTDAGAAGPGAAGHGQELLHRLRRLRPPPGGDAGEAAVPGLRVLQDPRRHRRAAEERAGGAGEAAGTAGRRPEAVRQALRRPPARRAALPGGPARPAAGRRGPPGEGRREGEGRGRRTPT